MAEVRMPKMGDGMEEGTINTWLKKEGDQVTSGEPIAEVETDKANVEIPAYETGVLTKIIVKEGETVPVGAVIAQIGEASAAAGGNGKQAPATAAAAQETTARPAGTGNGGSSKAGEEGRTPPAVPQEAGQAPAEEAHPEPPQTERVKASPLARRMAEELGLDLARIEGTGPGGRIVERDIKAFQERMPAVQSAAQTPAATTQQVRTAPPMPVPGLIGEEVKPSRMRAAIANRTVQSKQNIPHFYVTMVVEMDRALALLKELNADTPDNKITINDLIVKACAVALARVPQVNATWTPQNTVRYYKEAHIGVAVGIEDGLIVPVVRDCHVKPLRQIAADTKALIQKARAGQLKPEEYSGGTFSTSNLGMMGVDEFIAIINPPEAAILAIGGIVREPVVKEDSDEIVLRSRMKVTLSSDHRVLDGVISARFLQEVKKVLEAPFSLLS